MPLTMIENYKPDDRGWGVVLGRLMPKPPTPPEDEPDEAVSADEGDEA